ncbi:hypothetical protein [Metamycoplasma canadense]|uniref:Uncharacterized protein n=1 Tax=Metamycoplasma canadense TaxID=29554 RepID=A0A077L942_9BACT|nr:hypothetical protein [Metamycoplasma canadense]BAP39523.1 hypothetical protein MCAN360_0326 [Metamycoplasma canadense]
MKRTSTKWIHTFNILLLFLTNIMVLLYLSFLIKAIAFGARTGIIEKVKFEDFLEIWSKGQSKFAVVILTNKAFKYSLSTLAVVAFIFKIIGAVYASKDNLKISKTFYILGIFFPIFDFVGAILGRTSSPSQKINNRINYCSFCNHCNNQPNNQPQN